MCLQVTHHCAKDFYYSGPGSLLIKLLENNSTLSQFTLKFTSRIKTKESLSTSGCVPRELAHCKLCPRVSSSSLLAAEWTAHESFFCQGVSASGVLTVLACCDEQSPLIVLAIHPDNLIENYQQTLPCPKPWPGTELGLAQHERKQWETMCFCVEIRVTWFITIPLIKVLPVYNQRLRETPVH